MNSGVMMNNFAGPSDTQNFANNGDMYQDEEGGYIEGDPSDDTSEVPFMGNHVVKTVRNLRMR